ncbi:MAG: hypothetical protein MR681_07560 [Prevotella sp.]|nr:hypothetical protein [Prevotella sp.]
MENIAERMFLELKKTEEQEPLEEDAAPKERQLSTSIRHLLNGNECSVAEKWIIQWKSIFHPFLFNESSIAVHWMFRCRAFVIL